jgi:AcrR family transcriptional regulator
MTSTKEKILSTALELFNAEGIDGVTIRHIAKEMGISHGNLQYHYKNTNEIIRALYAQLVAALDVMVAGVPLEAAEVMDRLKRSVESAYHLIYEYRFIFLQFVEVCRRVPGIRKSYNNLIRKRERQFMGVIEFLRAAGLFRNDIPEAVLHRLIAQMVIISDFWLSSNEMILRLKDNQAARHYCEVFLALFYPYLTRKGLRYFN